MVDIDVKIIGNRLYANVLSEKTYKTEYAFYLYKDNIRVDTCWYAKDTKVFFDINSDIGIYHVKCFIRKLGETNSKIYNSEKINSKNISYDLEKWNTPLFEYGFHNIKENFLLEDGIHRFVIENQSIDILFQGASSFLKEKGVLVCFSAAVPNREKKLAPFFSGSKVAKSIGMPLIAIADPSLALSDTIDLAWYSGNENLKNISQLIANILDDISKKLDTKLILFGGSGGGFATLSVVHQMETNPRGVVWNPQTSISMFEDKAITNYIETCFSHNPRSSNLYDRLEEEEITHDLVKLYTQNNRSCNILYLQNTGDTYHIRRHAKPMMEAINTIQENQWTSSSSKGVVFWLKYWGKGHIVPSDNIIIEVLTKLIDNNDPLEIALEL